MPLYFAYGANMDVEEMARRCPRSRPIGVARLMRHRLAIMREGWLTATRDPRCRVHGVLWDLALADVAALDRFEGLGDGLYAKAVQPVVAASGPKRALVYFGANAGPGRADAAYIRAVIAAAAHWRLPEEGLAALQGFAREAGVGSADVAAPRVRPRFATPFDR
jgi:hypothetical protein